MDAAAHAVESSELTSDQWQARVDLAALYHLFVHYRWTDLTYTHLSARVPGKPDHYLINPYGLLFDEITASNLIEVDAQGRVVQGQASYNKAGHVIHTTILRARPEINFVLHSHTRAGAAVSAMRSGLLPLSQPAMVVLGTVAYHPYAVTEEEPEECARLSGDLGDKYVMILHNHGLLVCGRTAAEAFLYHYFVQSACEIQTAVMNAGGDYVMPSPDAVATLSAWSAPRPEPWGSKPWLALLRMLDRTSPSFRS